MCANCGRRRHLEKVDSYVYLGQEMNMRRNLQVEIACQNGWRKFHRIPDLLKVSIPKTMPALRQHCVESSEIWIRNVITEEGRGKCIDGNERTGAKNVVSP